MKIYRAKFMASHHGNDFLKSYKDIKAESLGIARRLAKVIADNYSNKHLLSGYTLRLVSIRVLDKEKEND